MTRQEIAENLTKLGLTRGSIVLLHSSLAAIGNVSGGADAVIDGFLDALGKEGTLLVPVFGKLGIITERLQARPEAVVSPCPLGTLAGIGPAAEELFKEHWIPESAHAENTPFYRLMEKHGFICLLGVDQDRNTALHGIEAELKLPYLGTETATFTTPDGETITKTWKYYPGPHRNFIDLDHRFAADGAMKTARLGDAQIRLIDAAKMRELGVEYGKANPEFVLCSNPACPDCVRQKAAVFSAQIAGNETFKLSMSSSAAGRYIPEMIENLQSCGINLIELDNIQGVPAASLPTEKLLSAVNELKQADISVSALRLPAAPENCGDLAKKLAEAKINTVLMPSAADDSAIGELKAAGLDVVIYNIAQNPSEVQQKSVKNGVGVCFNPANFAKCALQPFTVYRAARFIRNTVQLDINDGLFDGRPTRLAQGRAEIKEIISILRCQNFTGVFTLGGGSAYPAAAKELRDDFRELLKTM